MSPVHKDNRGDQTVVVGLVQPLPQLAEFILFDETSEGFTRQLTYKKEHIVLYVLTRWFPAPFGHGPESIKAIDLTCKACEAFGMVTLTVLIFQGLILNANSRIAWRAILLIGLFSIMAGFVTYGVAGAAEPIFPGLSAQAEEHHHEESSPQEGHLHESSFPEQHAH